MVTICVLIAIESEGQVNTMISRQKLIMAIANWQMTLMPGWSSANDTDTVIHNTLEELIGLIESQPPADQWIPCSSGRLPIHNTFFPQKVFVTYIEDSVRYTAKAWLNMDGKWINLSNGEHFDEGSVIAWMPAEPYKGVE